MNNQLQYYKNLGVYNELQMEEIHKGFKRSLPQTQIDYYATLSENGTLPILMNKCEKYIVTSGQIFP